MATRPRPRRHFLRLDQAIAEYLSCLELDRHRSPRTVTEYRADLGRFGRFAERAGVTTTAGLDRDLIGAYQRQVSRGRAATPAGPRPHSRTARRAEGAPLTRWGKFSPLWCSGHGVAAALV